MRCLAELQRQCIRITPLRCKASNGIGQVVALSLCVVAAPSVVAQEVPTLDRPEWRAVEPFSATCGIRLLSGGRVIVCDAAEQAVVLVGADGNRAFTIGRSGGGPGEYRQPSGLLRMPGDTTWLVDRALRRFLVIGPDGTPGRTVPFPPEAQTVPVFRGTDQAGRILFQPFWFPLKPGGGSLVPILRWVPGMESGDTIAHVLGPAPKVEVEGTSTARTNSFLIMPFTPQDEWAVLVDGTVVIARVDGYSLDVILPDGTVRHGPRIPFQPVRVNAGDRGENSGDNVEYPATKPPFSAGALRVDGQRIWVRRNTLADAPTVPWDMFDLWGKRIGTVMIAKDLRLVAFGPRLVYGIRTDEDGLEWLEGFSRP